MAESELLKVIESGGIIGLLIVGLAAFFKIAKMLYESQVNDLRESKLNRRHIDIVADKIDDAINEIKSSKEAIVSELQKQNLVSESNSTNQLAMIRMLEQLANSKLDKIEKDLIEVKNSTKDTQSILHNIKSAQAAKRQESHIRLRE